MFTLVSAVVAPISLTINACVMWYAFGISLWRTAYKLYELPHFVGPSLALNLMASLTLLEKQSGVWWWIFPCGSSAITNC